MATTTEMIKDQVRVWCAMTGDVTVRTVEPAPTAVVAAATTWAGVYSRTSRRSWGKTFETLPSR
jgi:hypothetical protein